MFVIIFFQTSSLNPPPKIGSKMIVNLFYKGKYGWQKDPIGPGFTRSMMWERFVIST